MTEIKLTRGVPPTASFPSDKLATCANAVLTQFGDIVLQYGQAYGFPPLCEHVAQEADADPRQVIIGQGSLQLQDMLARMLLEPGDLAYVEEPSYDRAIKVLRRVGARVVGLPLDDDGPDVDALETRLQNDEIPVLLYLIPDFQNPSGTVLSLEKRRRIAELAQEYSFWLVEDLPYRKLRYRGSDLPTLRELAPDRVLQMSSYSKLISPGLRVGTVVAPLALAGRLAKFAEDTYINASYVNQAMVYEFIRRGWFEPQIEQLKALYAPRLDALLTALETHMDGLATWTRPDGGFFVGMTLQADVSADALLREARAADLLLTDGRDFFANGGGDRFVRLPFCALTPDEIEAGVARLAQVVKKQNGED